MTQFSTDSSGARDESWSYGRVVLAVVPASNRYLAAALGSAAFGLADPLVDSEQVSHSDVQTVYDFDTAPASTLTSGWECDLPSSVRLDTDHGQELLETVLAKTDDGPVDTTSAHLFGVEGAPLGASDELDLLVEADEAYWLVPGIVRRYSTPLPDGPTRSLDCECRSLATPHVYTGRGGAPRPYDEPARPIWVCQCCRRPVYGPAPETDADDSSSLSSHPASDSPETRLPLQRVEHRQILSAYYDRHGHYPWEDSGT